LKGKCVGFLKRIISSNPRDKGVKMSTQAMGITRRGRGKGKGRGRRGSGYLRE